MQLQSPLLTLSSALGSRLDGSICSEGLVDVQDIHYIARIRNTVECYRPCGTSLIVDGPPCLWPPWRVRLACAIGSLSIRSTATGREQSASTIVDNDDLALADISDLPVLMSVVVRTGGSPEFKSLWWIFYMLGRFKTGTGREHEFRYIPHVNGRARRRITVQKVRAEIGLCIGEGVNAWTLIACHSAA